MLLWLHLVLSKGGDTPVRSSGTFKFKWGSAIALAPLIFFAATPHSVAAQAQGARTDIAVFDFELDDGSAGAGIAGDHAADNGYMKEVSTEVRRVIAQSGRYHLVDVSGADADAVRDHSLRTCNGCDAGIASALGAEQSLTGVVRRISRTEYVVGFQLRDAKSGALIAAQDTGLRMGANYSWSRGASRLIADRLLTERVKQPNPSN
ncbi:MAG: DUF3280 domain-containing protein [Methylocella sp.]